MTLSTMKNLNSTIYWLLHFLYIQLFLTLISLPILICWGLPISAMSVVGNLLFTPLLTIFLLLSSTVFFLELFHVPNSFLITLLEYLSHWWSTLLSYGSCHWMIAFAKPAWYVALFIPFCTLAIIHHKKMGTVSRRTLLFVILLTVTMGLLWQRKRAIEGMFAIPGEHGSLYVVKNKSKTVLIDSGRLSDRRTSLSYVFYQVPAELNKKVGSSHIDHLIIMHPTSHSFRAITALCGVVTIKRMYLPLWRGTVGKKFWYDYFTMKKMLDAKQVALVRLGGDPVTILLDTYAIVITPLSDEIKRSKIKYRAVMVESKAVDDPVRGSRLEMNHSLSLDSRIL